MRRVVFLIHKWVGIILGLVMLLWLITGFIFLAPFPGVKRNPPPQLTSEELTRVSLTPAEAVEKGGLEAAGSVELKKVAGRVIYAVYSKKGEPHFVDATTGSAFNITSEIAQEIALGDFLQEAGVAKVSTLKWHSTFYGWGPLPVYRVDLDDPGETTYYINSKTGKIERLKDYWIRIRDINHQFHNFSIFKVVMNFSYQRQILILITGMGCVFGVITGYYLWLSRGK